MQTDVPTNVGTHQTLIERDTWRAHELKDVTLIFGGATPKDDPVLAVHEINIAIPAGQFVAVVGPSGCGKTTILNMLAGLLKPTQGSVRRHGEEVEGTSRDIGYMLARSALSPWRTARKNVELGLEIRGIPRRERKERAMALLERVSLHEFANSFPSQLSQGMNQRVAIARTLAIDPDLWLMDEPFGALDAPRLKVQGEFVQLWEEAANKTVILVTHDLEEAVLLADRVIVMTARTGAHQVRHHHRSAETAHYRPSSASMSVSRKPNTASGRNSAMKSSEEPRPTADGVPPVPTAEEVRAMLPNEPTWKYWVGRIDIPVQLGRLALLIGMWWLWWSETIWDGWDSLSIFGIKPFPNVQPTFRASPGEAWAYLREVFVEKLFWIDFWVTVKEAPALDNRVQQPELRRAFRACLRPRNRLSGAQRHHRSHRTLCPSVAEPDGLSVGRRGGLVLSLQLAPLTGAVGAVVHGVELRSVDSEQAQQLRDAWHRHGVLFFRNQHLSDEEHVQAAHIFGEPELFTMAPSPGDEPLVHSVSNPDGPNRYSGATSWHSDATWKKQRPPRGSMLRAIHLPEVGGDTLFASAAGAYQSLSSGLQRMVDQLTATHAGGFALAKAGELVDREVPPPVHHPVVRVHPDSGDRCLYVNGVFTQEIDDIPRPESRALLPLLCDVFKDPEIQCRYRWGDGDVAIWDNRAVQHYAAPDYEAARTMYRVVLAGDPVVGIHASQEPRLAP
ncbi:putative ABC transporter ATP-binding protein [Nymphon striatum]|nr:putative ABC transporter ATP-binding protein [Nymphon striatum]